MKYFQTIASELFKGFEWTHWLSFITIVAVTVYIILTDIPLALNKVQGDTYSERIKALAQAHMLVPAFAGVVCGHWFWPGPMWLTGWGSAFVLALCVILLVAGDVANSYATLPFIDHLEKNPQLVFMFFFGVGHIAWSQGV